MRLFRINESAEQKADKVVLMEPPLTRRILDPCHAVVLDAFCEIYIWTGRYCPPREKQIAGLLAAKFLVRTILFYAISLPLFFCRLTLFSRE